ncbi:F-box only protein 27-like [Balaenoptera ricei]|uniref:F-box only protein 27-like n=1 Tax=Balaenoptera ricei TaxID=2746895 RepID=UPI0028BECC6C|nr:F-box only protein 27-like [Balaenoptera ricei]
MCASASKDLPTRVPTLDPQPKEALGLGQLPTELLEVVLSHVPPHVLLGRCRRVCPRWCALVDCQALWLNILARDHAALWPIISTYLPPADDPRPCVLGRFCERRPIGRNLLRNPKGEGGEPRKGVLMGAGGKVLRGRHRKAKRHVPGWCHKKEVLDLEEEGLWPELLDSGKMEICVSDWWTDQQYTDSLYRLIVQHLDASQAVLHHCSPLPFPIPQCRNSFSFEASHVFSNLRIGVHFVSFEHWVRDIDFCSQPYLIYLFNSGVIVRVRLS